MKLNQIYACCIFLSSSACGSQPTSLDSLFDIPLEQLLTIEVTVAARKQESWLAAAGTVYVISQEEIARFGWRDIKEILTAIPNMDMFYQWNWLPGGQRGFTGNMAATLLLIDGREVQNLLANEAFMMNNFPAHRIQRVEVLQGPNSTLYGGNAAQGVINIITRLPGLDDPQAPAEDIFEIGAVVGEADTVQGNLLYSGSRDAWRYGLSLSWFSSDLDYQQLREFVADDQRFSRDPALNQIRDHDASRFRNDEQNITLDARLAYQDYYLGIDLTRTENVSGIERVAYDFVIGDDSRRGYSLIYAGRHFQPGTDWQGFVELSQFREYKEKDRQMVRNAQSAANYDELDVFTEREDIGPSYRYRLRTQFKHQIGEHQDWIIGYDGWQTDINSRVSFVATDNGVQKQVPASWPQDKEKSDKHAVYSQYAHRWTLQEQASLNMTLGLRYNRQDFTEDAWLPRISLVFQPDHHSAWKLTYGEAFRPPTIFEFDGVEDSSLASQTVDMLELNYSRGWQWQEMEMTNVTALYKMQIRNFYKKVFDTEQRFWRTEVSGEQAVTGLENLLKIRSGRWHGFWGLRYVSPDKQEVAGQMAVVDVPRSKLKLGLSYDFNQHWQASLFLDHWAKTLTQANSIDGSSQILETVAAWTTVNLNVQSKGWLLPGGQQARVGLYVENLFDQRYYHANARGSNPYQFIQAPRNLRLQLSLNF